ncbi:MAG: histidinol dehydrogenase [Acidimicrobiia bacterium]|nr:histidinol dehydrogenase [Acidimicrobiia bacterium]
MQRVILSDLSPSDRQRIVRRSAVVDPKVRAGVAAICEEIRTGRDAALVAAADRFGGGRPAGMVVTRSEMDAALASAPAEERLALETAIANVTTYHQVQMPEDRVVETMPGVEIARRWSPMRRIGAYVPGGKAAYPSTLIMTVTPARLAGVEEVVVVSPADPDGRVSSTLLAAAALLEVDEMYIVGGAQAVAALAYGTEIIRPVDKIVGPGNAWVTAAKLYVFGECGIDLPAGPSEVCVLADETSDPRLVAVDLLSQAEHGPDSPAVLVTADETLFDRVDVELNDLLERLSRRAILGAALVEHGLMVLAPSHEEAIEFVDAYAPEHATVLTADPDSDAKRIRGAGSIYVGRWSPESAGDYATGANHVLPTGGLARAYGPLSVEDFGSWRQVQTLTREGLGNLRPTIACLAEAEGLTAHRLAADLRFEAEGSS